MKVKKHIILVVVIISTLLLGVVMWRVYGINDVKRAVSTAPTNLPPPVDPETIGKVVRDNASGRDFISNQIIVEFNADISEETALAIIARVGGKMEQRFTAVPLFLIRVDDNGDGVVARSVVRELSKDVRIKKAELNFLTTKPVENGTGQ
jgi:hypothetical protein